MRLLLRPRVLHLTQPVDGGVARVVTDLVRAQLADGFGVTVACPDGADGPLGGQLRALGADVRPWNAARAPGCSLLGEVRRLTRLVDDVRPDLVHAHSAKAGLAGRLAVRGRIPTVFQPHAWSFEAVGGGTAALARAWERWGARWAARVVCVSEEERATGLRAGITAHWHVVPNGVDPRHFSPAPGPIDPGHSSPAPADPTGTTDTSPATAGDAPHAPHAPLVVCVGRLCRQKGQDVLLRAWGPVAERVPGARLVLVGDGPDHDRLRDLAPPSVAFTGAVADPLPWYRAADVVVLPSRWEGMALAPLEAMACARPVVAADVGGARESLPPALAARCLVPAGDPAALARAVTALLLDAPLRAELGRLGRAHVLSAHDVRRRTAAVTALYHDLLAARPGAARPAPQAPPAEHAVPSEHRESTHS
ncbi:glycosyltransferase [Streptomyces sp. PsTaAH-124]|uniref:glycosyltransferase n=1 Tax=Streptomyces sp. PsTaAH-124 TaxID=1157638 RepID=UPI00037F2549|nr:glycosyltransferase [Streptomyces sp. PsTaAH-124]